MISGGLAPEAVLVVTLGTDLCALPARDVEEIAPAAGPNGGAVALDEALGRTDVPRPGGPRLLRVRTPSGTLGLIVWGRTELVSIGAGAWMPLPRWLCARPATPYAALVQLTSDSFALALDAERVATQNARAVR
jgi:hypothetical protein